MLKFLHNLVKEWKIFLLYLLAMFLIQLLLVIPDYIRYFSDKSFEQLIKEPCIIFRIIGVVVFAIVATNHKAIVDENNE